MSHSLIGTPITDDNPKYAPVWNQTATDEKGRRRFHGAFEGGFSAGYFNTVGSAEGFQPQTFKSSRDDRNKYKQRVEDFMDEEDLEQSLVDGKILAAKKIHRPTPEDNPILVSVPSKRRIDNGDEPPRKKRVMGPSLADIAGIGTKAKESTPGTLLPAKSVYLSITRKVEDFRGIGFKMTVNWAEKPSFLFYGNITIEEKKYPAPSIPVDFDGIHRYKEELITPQQRAFGKEMNATQRGELLGEEVLVISKKEKKNFVVNDFIKHHVPDMLTSRFTKAKLTHKEIVAAAEKRGTEEKKPKEPEPLLPPLREVEDWAPDRLLCKRFGEVDPYANSIPQLRVQRIKSNVETMFPTKSQEPKAPERKEPTMAELKQEIPEKPDMSIFKAIFDDSESEDESEQ